MQNVKFLQIVCVLMGLHLPINCLQRPGCFESQVDIWTGLLSSLAAPLWPFKIVYRFDELQ